MFTFFKWLPNSPILTFPGLCCPAALSGLASVVFDKALRTPAGSVKTEQQKEAQQDVGPPKQR